MGRILVTGANGFVGRTVCTRLTKAGHIVVAGLRREADNAIPGAHDSLIVGDLASWQPAPAQLARIEQIVHLAAIAHRQGVDETRYEAVNHHATIRLARAAADAGCRQFIFISSIKVLGDVSPAGRAFDDASPPAPPDAYARSKLNAERELVFLSRLTGMSVIILRPPLVHGPAATANMGRLLRLCAKGGIRGLPVPLGRTDNRRSLIAVDSLADAIAAVVSHPENTTGAYALADQPALSTAAMIRALSAGMVRRPPLFGLPPAWLGMILRLLGKQRLAERLLSDLVIDDRRFRTDFGWQPMADSAENLRQTGAAYLASQGTDNMSGLPNAPLHR